MTTLSPYCSNPAKEAKINVNFHFNTFLENLEEVYEDRKGSFIKHFTVPQKSAKIKTYVNFVFKKR